MYKILLSFNAYSLQISAVESVEALSEIINSKSVNVCVKTESIAYLIYFSPLYAGISILTFGFLLMVNSNTLS